MKKETHPAFHPVAFKCSCGNVITVGSTMQKDNAHVDVCSSCHPFYTGKQKLVDVGGRLDKFRKKYAESSPKAA